MTTYPRRPAFRRPRAGFRPVGAPTKFHPSGCDVAKPAILDVMGDRARAKGPRCEATEPTNYTVFGSWAPRMPVVRRRSARHADSASQGAEQVSASLLAVAPMHGNGPSHPEAVGGARIGALPAHFPGKGLIANSLATPRNDTGSSEERAARVLRGGRVAPAIRGANFNESHAAFWLPRRDQMCRRHSRPKTADASSNPARGASFTYGCTKSRVGASDAGSIPARSTTAGLLGFDGALIRDGQLAMVPAATGSAGSRRPLRWANLKTPTTAFIRLRRQLDVPAAGNGTRWRHLPKICRAIPYQVVGPRELRPRGGYADRPSQLTGPAMEMATGSWSRSQRGAKFNGRITRAAGALRNRLGTSGSTPERPTNGAQLSEIEARLQWGISAHPSTLFNAAAAPRRLSAAIADSSPHSEPAAPTPHAATSQQGALSRPFAAGRSGGSFISARKVAA